MPRVAPVVPSATDILCESCGYTLNGLPESGNCPECGQPIAASTIDAGRVLCAWDQSRTSPALIATTSAVLFHPTKFFRTLATRADVQPARRFAKLHWMISSLLFAIAAGVHTQWFLTFGGVFVASQIFWIGCSLALMIAVYFTLQLVTKFAAMLTNWEATYRGYRMPIDPVLRGMYYHAAHYLPVALISCVTVVGFVSLARLGVVSPLAAIKYLYVLCGEVIVLAAYLFQTYWIAMRSMMYANR